MTGAGVRYRPPSGDDCRIRPLDALTLIYHRPSGQTHLVAPPVPEILAVMAGEVLDAAEVAARLADRFELDSGEDPAAIVAARLDELAELGLVKRLSSQEMPEQGGVDRAVSGGQGARHA